MVFCCTHQGTPYCSRYADGRTCTGPDACTDADSGGGQPEGARCSTSPTRGNPRGMPCARGLICQIRDQGMIAAAVKRFVEVQIQLFV